MKISVLLGAVTLGLHLCCATARAADEPAKSSTPDPVPREATATVLAPTDLTAFREALGTKVAVEGTIVAAAESKTKTVRYLNFTKNYRESVSLVFFKSGDEFTLEKLSAWVGRKVRATGKVSDHAGALQIEIEKKEQIEELK